MAPLAAGFADSTRHRIAVRLLAFLFVIYITNCLDTRDLGFSDRVIGLGIGVSIPTGIV